MARAPASDPAFAPESLATALLLAGTAGMLDAATYLLHGRVFATAMTGNTVLLGISAVSGNWYEFVRHAVPIAAFLAGVAVSKAMRVALGGRAILPGLLLEIGTLVAAGFLPGTFPEALFTGSISFACAMQVGGLRHVGPYMYSSTFVSGDLLEFAESVIEATSPRADRTARRRATGMGRDLGLVWSAFVVGATIGGLSAPHLGNHAYWLPVPVLLGIVPAVRRGMRGSGQPSA